MLCLVYASHNGVSESELLDLFPEMELPVLSSLLLRLTRLCVLTLRCGLIRFQHLQVTPCWPLHAIVIIRVSIFNSIWVFCLGLGGGEAGVPGWRHQLCCISRATHPILQSATQVGKTGLLCYEMLSTIVFTEGVPTVCSQDRVTWRVADELPWLLQQQEDRTKLQLSLLNLFVSQNLYKRCATHSYYKGKMLHCSVIFI